MTITPERLEKIAAGLEETVANIPDESSIEKTASGTLDTSKVLDFIKFYGGRSHE